MKTTITLAVLLTHVFTLHAQENRVIIPMTEEHWEAEPGRAEFITHKSVPAIKIMATGENLFTGPAQVVLKDFEFTDGTIEYDVELTDFFLSIIYFRREDAQNSDMFYLRTYRADDPVGPDAVQYTTLTKGVALWDLHPRYQGPAVIHKEGWNHIKLVVSGRQMQIFVNDISQPTLVIPELLDGDARGGIAFEGGGIYANLVVRPGDTKGNSSEAGFDPISHDTRYIHSWEVSEPVDLPLGNELVSAAVGGGIYSDYLPVDSSSTWEYMETEREGLVNLSKRYGKSERRRFVWLRKTIKTQFTQEITMNLGFSDEVWVLLNGGLVYVDKNIYSQPIQKDLLGQISIENASFVLPLTEGKHELLIGIANTFFGWGIMPRFEHKNGITFE